MKRLLVLAALLFALPAHAEVTIDWVTVGDPGNDPDTHDAGWGSVGYVYEIAKYEVTNAQYAELLNAVAATDTYALYHLNMGDSNPGTDGHGGVTRSGSSGSYTYGTIGGREDMPVNYVSWYDTLRFANWLHNGQPTGAQDLTTTEDGAYDMSLGISVVRKPSAKVFLTSEDEWYKAAYYDAGSEIYYDFPAGSDTETTCAVPGATANTANCDWVVNPPDGDPAGVGSYTGSASPYGTFDQGGNVWEWNEAIIGNGRCVRGGAFTSGDGSILAVAYRYEVSKTTHNRNTGFRVASPGSAPPVPSLSPVGVALMGGLVFGIGIMGMVIAARRRSN